MIAVVRDFKTPFAVFAFEPARILVNSVTVCTALVHFLGSLEQFKVCSLSFLSGEGKFRGEVMIHPRHIREVFFTRVAPVGKFDIVSAVVVSEDFIAVRVDQIFCDFAEFVCQSLRLFCRELAAWVSEVVNEFVHGVFQPLNHTLNQAAILARDTLQKPRAFGGVFHHVAKNFFVDFVIRL